MSSTLSPTDFDSLEIQGQYNDINNRWDLPDSDWDNDSSSARLFERSRIKALAGEAGWRASQEGGLSRSPCPTGETSFPSKKSTSSRSTPACSPTPASRTDFRQGHKMAQQGE